MASCYTANDVYQCEMNIRPTFYFATASKQRRICDLPSSEEQGLLLLLLLLNGGTSTNAEPTINAIP